jgi:hypothetical protein
MKLDELRAEGLVLFGGKDDVREAVADHEARGTDMLMLWVSPRGVSIDDAARCLEAFAAEVMPEFLGPNSLLIGAREPSGHAGEPAA